MKHALRYRQASGCPLLAYYPSQKSILAAMFHSPASSDNTKKSRTLHNSHLSVLNLAEACSF